MNTHTLNPLVTLLLLSAGLHFNVLAQQRKPPSGGRIAVVVDERLAALRSTPQLSGKLLRRIGRGKLVAVRGVKVSKDGVVFYLVNVTSRTHGWIQREAVVSRSQSGDDQRLLSLIKGSADFDRIVRARIFLDHFPRSPLRAEVLLRLGDAAEEVGAKLAREATRRVNEADGSAPAFSYFLNYSGLDRYNRQGVTFVFDRSAKKFHYDGAAWREILRRFPKTVEADEARRRLAQLVVAVPNRTPER